MSRQFGLPPPKGPRHWEQASEHESDFPPGAVLFAIAFGVLTAAVFLSLVAIVLRVL